MSKYVVEPPIIAGKTWVLAIHCGLVLHGGAHWHHLTSTIQQSMFGSPPKTATSGKTQVLATDSLGNPRFRH